MVELLHALGSGGCLACGGASARYGPRGALCGACWEEVPTSATRLGGVPEGVGAGWHLAPYAGPLGALLRRAKYTPDPALLVALGGLLAAGVPEGRYDAVVPVPSSWASVLWRGFVPAVLLARPVAGRLGVPLVAALGRPWGRRRASVARRERASRVPIRREGRLDGRVLLVDDVLTTGGTAGACARALLEGGASSVDLLVVAAARQVVSTA